MLPQRGQLLRGERGRASIAVMGLIQELENILSVVLDHVASNFPVEGDAAQVLEPGIFSSSLRLHRSGHRYPHAPRNSSCLGARTAMISSQAAAKLANGGVMAARDDCQERCVLGFNSERPLLGTAQPVVSCRTG